MDGLFSMVGGRNRNHCEILSFGDKNVENHYFQCSGGDVETN